MPTKVKRRPVKAAPTRREGYAEWKPIILVQVYKLIKAGCTEKQVCELLEVSGSGWMWWKKHHPELIESLELARSDRDSEWKLSDYCFARLSPELQDLWQRIMELQDAPTGVAQIELLLSDHGTRVRQQLYLHALVECDFNPSNAMYRIGVSQKMVTSWINDDPEFGELVEQMSFHKKNFFESALVGLVGAGVPSAIIFANKTQNRDRGYGNMVKVEHSGTIQHNVLDLAELLPYLTEEGRTALLEAIRLREAELLVRKAKAEPLSLEATVATQIQETSDESEPEEEGGHTAP
jgi:hypothetical protein